MIQGADSTLGHALYRRSRQPRLATGDIEIPGILKDNRRKLSPGSLIALSGVGPARSGGSGPVDPRSFSGLQDLSRPKSPPRDPSGPRRPGWRRDCQLPARARTAAGPIRSESTWPAAGLTGSETTRRRLLHLSGRRHACGPERLQAMKGHRNGPPMATAPQAGAPPRIHVIPGYQACTFSVSQAGRLAPHGDR
jgi:hypothetical protein